MEPRIKTARGVAALVMGFPVRLLHEYLFDGEDGPWLAMWSSVGLSQAELGTVATAQRHEP